MRNTAYNFVRPEHGILADISNPLSTTFKYTLPLKIKDLKYRVDFYKIQNPYRNWCNVTCNICMGSRQIQMSQQPSSYWITIKISKSKCNNEYFESYGLGTPTVHFKKFMKYNYIYNSKRLQHSLSTTCAQWCIYYIWKKCQGWSLRNILKPFYSKDFLINDHVLNLVVNNNFKINRKVIGKEFVKIQIARKTAEKNMHS